MSSHETPMPPYPILRNLTHQQIEAALEASGYFDNHLMACRYRGGDTTPTTAHATYEVAFYDHIEGEMGLGNVYVTIHPDFTLTAEF